MNDEPRESSTPPVNADDVKGQSFANLDQSETAPVCTTLVRKP
jgi:hypothetical protein